LRTLQPPWHRNATGLGCSEFARHYYRNRGFFLFLQVLRWFTSLSSLTSAYVFSGVFPGFAREGFPIRRSPVITPVCGLPKLIAACHVLHRLSLPRHSPCALSSLTIELTPSIREPNHFGPDRSQPTYFRLESGLAHSHAQSPQLLKTLFLLEHLPKPQLTPNLFGITHGLIACARPCIRALLEFTPLACAGASRRPLKRGVRIQCALPNQFRCQTSLPSILARRRALRLGKTCQPTEAGRPAS
jgi:hypothetical protein